MPVAVAVIALGIVGRPTTLGAAVPSNLVSKPVPRIEGPAVGFHVGTTLGTIVPTNVATVGIRVPNPAAVPVTPRMKPMPVALPVPG